jgi:hypothetical protein
MWERPPTREADRSGSRSMARGCTRPSVGATYAQHLLKLVPGRERWAKEVERGVKEVVGADTTNAESSGRCESRSGGARLAFTRKDVPT